MNAQAAAGCETGLPPMNGGMGQSIASAIARMSSASSTETCLSEATQLTQAAKGAV